MNPIISVIIPQKNSLDTLGRLLESIPEDERVEAIIVDNSEKAIAKAQIDSKREFQLLHSSPERFAGGARNVGLQNAKGEWLIFSDADDFFAPNAFDVFFSYVDSDYDLIYFKVTSVYDDTLEPSNRDEMWNGIVDGYTNGSIDELGAKISYVVPWGKMVRKSLVDSMNIQFDEVVASNDVMFSTKVGYYAKKFTVSKEVVYTVTTRKGSLANRRDLRALESRYRVRMRRNIFLKEQGLADRQISIMSFLYDSLKFGIKPFFKFLGLAIKNRQNFFIGYRNWIQTARFVRKDDKEKKKYLKK